MSTPDSRSEDKVVGILCENFAGKFITNSVRETSPVAFPFLSLEVEGKLEEGSLGLIP